MPAWEDRDGRLRFADFRSVTRSVTLDMPISATASLVEIAHDLLRTVLTDYPAERSTSVGDLRVAPGEHWDVQLGLPPGLEDEERRPGTKEAGRVGSQTALLT